VKEPRITVLATEALLRQLLAADDALKASKRADKAAGEIHSLIVQLTMARARALAGSDAKPPV
jgi:hypothetical protein